MSTKCLMCGRPLEGRGDICEACKEGVRAEAMGKHRKIAKQNPTETAKPGAGNRKGVKDDDSLPTPHEEDEEKKPHHFKSMAEYLEYLKGKEGK